ncbi:AraC family transcriptional regulator [Mesorhizobium sp. WSM4312]|uniref:helix-turn-helix domain-containing protein n=1 Tax=unclassified Mesorhizobium TaxID=325217 RepID=UPI000BAF34E6|nr:MULTISPECIES: helix-turn-helix domain-containing protein [unclassified Mesorhizobium]PBB22407.1 AraC family transcriptional regulator [Mesorhizobium sp. WSM4304]PBB64661.1 AraC family transcriptional regulator [Mesorhizobium sp. WSM4312]PBB71343.1 AraC family transcriptional regulator [Mesorhizobium sp. WSM4308]PBC20232.1 AraC family transcriptional regulator [Mesorhizobium sp. WSM4311]TRC71295.1 helix-turn-helix domain-containing protein [Mesorhizobium sp. WSM4315]
MDTKRQDEAPARQLRDLDRRRWPREGPPHNEAAPPLGPALEPLSFSTLELAPEDQFAAWQAHMTPLVEVRLPDDKLPDDGFPADHTAWNLGGMLIVQQRAPAHSYMRSAAKLRSSSIDHWYIVLPRTGRSWTEVDRRVAENLSGKLEIRSLGYPFRGRVTDSESLFLYLPRDLFSDAASTLDAKNNSILSGNFADLLVDYVNSVEARLRSLTAEDLPRIVHAARSMIIACLAPPTEHAAAAEQLASVALMERARRYVQNNLDAAHLTPDSMCRALGVSRSRLYQLFEPSGGVLHYIQSRRLLAAHVALSDPADSRRIVDIAEAFGFSSAANFSRAFSKEFGYSPREGRSTVVLPRPAHSVSLAEHEKASSFEGWLKALGH